MSDQLKAIHPASVKARGDGDTGEFESIVSVFSNVDLQADVVEPGAYADWIEELKAGDDPLPVIWSHDWSDPLSHIGEAKDVAELLPGDERLPERIKDLGGLWVLGQMDMDLMDKSNAAGAKARHIWKLLKGRRVRNFSFHYDIVEQGFGKSTEGRNVRLLKKLRVNEVGPTFMGVNRETDLVSAKAGAGLTADEVAALRAMIARDNPAAQATEGTPKGHLPRLDPVTVLANSAVLLGELDV
jgi:HK97 family phage prohead protease